MDTPPEHRDEPPQIAVGSAFVSKFIRRPDSDIAHFMRQATSEMDAHYKRIQTSVREDPGTAGDDSEGNWQQLLSAWLPSEYPVETKGRIVFPDGYSSPQVDVVILNPCYPEKLREGKRYLAGGVLAAFECKLTLTAKHIAEARAKCSEIKQHCLMNGSPYRELHSRISYGLLAHSHHWKSESSTPAKNVFRGLDKALGEVRHPREMLDWVCVADLGTWISEKSIWLHEARPRHESKYCVLDGAGGREVTEAEFFGGKPKPPDPPGMGEIFRPKVSASYFGLSGVSPIGCFIVSLLYKLAWSNPQLKKMVWDMLQSGLIQAGCGKPRCWPLEFLPAALIEKMCQAPTNQHWNEWSTSFCSIG